jgi:hypothetical protein
MPKVTKPSAAPKSQRDRFIEAARELECDDDKERFEQRLKKIAKAKPKSGSHK